ncbi:MAG TPA: DbpA RNA binding domain-containing protein [Gemmatimonadales bacterium]|nr:DbpA RNA binding domain-containing protein [Gemmatimonadales bacterium]
MPSLEELHIQPAIAATLQSLGWTSDHPAVREAAPTAARGHNLVAVTPPIPSYASPALAGVLSRLDAGRRALVLVPAGQLEEWGVLIHRLARDTPIRVHVARGTARAMRQLRADALDVLVATADTALTLVGRSALQMDRIGSLVLAWPELMTGEDSITPLMQDLPKDAQRLVYTSEAGRVDSLVERYARKALTTRLGDESLPVGPVRTVTVSWSGRIRALADLVELLDPTSLTVWTADSRYHDAITESIAGNPPELQLVMEDAPSSSTIIAFDVPPAHRLRQLVTAGEVVVLVPPGAEAYLARIAAPRRVLQLPGPLDEARSAEAAQRRRIVETIETGRSQRALLTLAPLFERYDSTAVAAALYEIWTGSALPPAASAEVPASARIYVGIGKKDGATANDLVAVLTKELRVDRTKIGRIELRDAYSLIEIPAAEAEQVAGALNGATVRRRRVTARVDRGSTRPARSDGRSARPPRRADRS